MGVRDLLAHLFGRSGGISQLDVHIVEYVREMNADDDSGVSTRDVKDYVAQAGYKETAAEQAIRRLIDRGVLDYENRGRARSGLLREADRMSPDADDDMGDGTISDY